LGAGEQKIEGRREKGEGKVRDLVGFLGIFGKFGCFLAEVG